MDKSFFCKRIDYFQGTMVRKQITLQMNFNRSITFLFMLLTLLGFEQDEQKVYSLWARYEKEISVEEKVYLLDDLNDLHICTKPDSAKNIIEEMIANSKADTYKHGILRGDFCWGIIIVLLDYRTLQLFILEEHWNAPRPMMTTPFWRQLLKIYRFTNRTSEIIRKLYG